MSRSSSLDHEGTIAVGVRLVQYAGPAMPERPELRKEPGLGPLLKELRGSLGLSHKDVAVAVWGRRGEVELVLEAREPPERLSVRQGPRSHPRGARLEPRRGRDEARPAHLVRSGAAAAGGDVRHVRGAAADARRRRTTPGRRRQRCRRGRPSRRAAAPAPARAPAPAPLAAGRKSLRSRLSARAAPQDAVAADVARLAAPPPPFVRSAGAAPRRHQAAHGR